MAESAPNVVVLAGPNGAGKSTSARCILQDTLGIDEFVNADVIARGPSDFGPERAAMAAGRIMLARRRELARQRFSVAFETTSASRSFAPWLAELIQSRYRFHLVFLRLPSPEMAVARVAARVLDGGHDVPEGTIRRRHEAGIRNLFELCQPMASSWKLCENPAVMDAPPVVAERFGRARDDGREVKSIMLDAPLVEQALHRAVVQAMTRHKRLGNPIVVWCAGRVVWIPAEEIRIPDEATDAEP